MPASARSPPSADRGPGGPRPRSPRHAPSTPDAWPDARGRRLDVVLTPELLEVIAHSLTAFLGVWLGLTVLTRSGAPAGAGLRLPRPGPGRLEQQRHRRAPVDVGISAIQVGHAVEEFAAALIIPATAHFSLVIATEGHPSRRQVQAIALAYVVNVRSPCRGSSTRRPRSRSVRRSWASVSIPACGARLGVDRRATRHAADRCRMAARRIWQDQAGRSSPPPARGDARDRGRRRRSGGSSAC